MNKLKVSTRLMLLIGVLSTLLIGIGGLGLSGIDRSNDALKSVFEDRTIPAAQLGRINALVLRNRMAINIALVTPTPEVIEERSAQIAANKVALDKDWEAYMATSLTPEEAKLATTFAADRQRFVREALMPTVAALRANDIKEALRLATGTLRSLSTTLETDIAALIKIQIDEARSDYDTAATRYAMIRVVFIAATAGGLLFAAIFGFTLVRSLGRQLGGEPDEAANVARSVAAGDLSVVIVLKPGDATSMMAQLKAMQASLAKVVSSVRQNSESVATASAQIAQGNMDLSQRTEEQASALEETAASMEELSSTVKQNADNARQANQLALSASTVAIRGGDVVAQVVSTMKTINDSSKKIADIIGVIDSIAFQTNILALNAAVEAARAGEQGRGFAVVATEVRNLASRSAEAAKEIKHLIGSSVERVEQGTTLVDKAGVTMAEVVGSIKRVTDIMGEISAASAEQSAGVSQVGNAVNQMDQVTQQNAALVEESAAAAESLKDQARQLVQAVAVFKLPPFDETHPANHAPAASPKSKSTSTAKHAGNGRRDTGRASNMTRAALRQAPLARARSGAAPALAFGVADTSTESWTSF